MYGIIFCMAHKYKKDRDSDFLSFKNPLMFSRIYLTLKDLKSEVENSACDETDNSDSDLTDSSDANMADIKLSGRF